MAVEVRALFVGAGCNRSVKAASWGPSGLVAFGVHSSVAIYCPQRVAILVQLTGHKDQVNCVEWLPRDGDLSTQDKFHLLSGCADGAIVLWELAPSKHKWTLLCQAPTSHEKSVSCISSTMLSPTEALCVSSGSDTTVRVWSVSLNGGCNISLLQAISTDSRPMVAVSIVRLPGGNSSELVLATGGLDNNIHLYIGTTTGQFNLACSVKGHQDWIRSLDFSKPVLENGVSSLFLASSSQDRNIRIWKISPMVQNSTSSGPSLKEFIEGPVIKSGSKAWQVSSESLLMGHEDWVYSVCWQPSIEDEIQPMSVLSSSMDKTMMIWRPEAKSGIWMNEVAVGELGHSAFGFYGGVWGPKGDAILAHGFYGSLHLWKNVNSSWRPQLTPSGHFGPVVDVAWAKTGQFLLSASHDQTTRVFACWNTDSKPESSWHEIARPQIHGHDMNCLAVIRGRGNHRYVSGADEKVARVFEAPSSFLDTVALVTNETVETDGVKILGANMSALGLSQKPIYTQGETAVDTDPLDTMDSFPSANPVVLTEPPFEEQLAQNTLWPESHKLYGHGNEIYSMCCSHDGHILATACKATTPHTAEIWLWETSTWRAIAQLHSHSLTVVQMEFSHDDQFLLSVSRDRHFSVFRRRLDGGETNASYDLLEKTEAHKRIVWTCSWSPCDRYFATGSRDKHVKIWSIVSQDVRLQTTLPIFKSSVTALAWSRLLAVGLESGMIELWCSSNFSCLKRLDPQACHSATVNRLVWDESRDANAGGRLASCGEDHAVRIFSID